MQEAKVDIQGMSCGHCMAAVKRALEGLEGVEVRDVQIGSAKVAYDPAVVAPGAIERAIQDEGYSARVR